MYDLIIIGAGPAGITAGIYAARKKIRVLVITGDIGGQTNWTAGIENYTGYQFITGIELVKRFRQHLSQFDELEMHENERVTAVEKDGDLLRVETPQQTYTTKSVVIASGRVHRKLGVAGEEEYIGKGVAYCATCDAPLFADQDVAVVGGGNSALDATLQLLKIANRVYLVDIAREFRADRCMVEKALSSDRLTVYRETKLKEVFGEKFVNGIAIEKDGRVERMPVAGVFIAIGSVASSQFASLVARNAEGEIIVNCKCETDVPGVFAAGDVTNIPAKQIIVACGEGAKAAISAFHYISTLKEPRLSAASSER